MRELLIVGARGWGREVYADVIKTKEYIRGTLKVKGFLDSNKEAFNNLKGDYPPILCSPEDYIVQPGDTFFIALGDSKWRKYYSDIIIAKGGELYTFISEFANVNSTAIIGKGSFIGSWSIISDNVKIGDNVIIHSFSTIGHDAIIKDYSTILAYVFMGGYSELGECSTMNPKSMVIPHKKIGNNVNVGAGSVVIKNIKDGLSVHGNPAKKFEL